MSASKKIQLSESERIHLDALISFHRDYKINRRLLCIRMLDQGKTRGEATSILDVSYQCIIEWVDIYMNQGLDGLCVFNYDGRRKPMLQDHEQDLVDFVSNNVITNFNQIVGFVNNDLGIPMKYNGIYDFVKKNLILLRSNQPKSHLRKQKNPSKKHSSKN